MYIRTKGGKVKTFLKLPSRYPISEVFNKASYNDFSDFIGDPSLSFSKMSYDYALTDDGKLYTWGEGLNGQLGNGSDDDCHVATCLNDITGNALNGKRITYVNKVSDTFYAIDSDGKLYTWGCNNGGQLADGTTNCSNVPICISDKAGHIFNGKKLTFIDGYSCAYALDSEDKLYMWGDNICGVLCTGDYNNSLTPICITDIATNPLYGKKVKYISGYETMYALTTENKVYTWGGGKCGQLGNGTNENSTIPICLNDIPECSLNGKKIVSIKNNKDDYHPNIYLLDDEGKVYSWGYNQNGELGNGSIENSNIPICISDIDYNTLYGIKITSIETEYATDNNGKTYLFGLNSTVPVCINDCEKSALKNKIVKKIINNSAIDQDGKLYSWSGEIINAIVCDTDNNDSEFYGLTFENGFPKRIFGDWIYNFYITKNGDILYQIEPIGR